MPSRRSARQQLSGARSARAHSGGKMRGRPDPCVTSFTSRPAVSAGGRSGGTDRPVHVSVSVSAGPGLPVTHLRGGCHVVRVRLGRRGRDLRRPAVADNSRYRASGSREHRDAGQLAPASARWLRRLEPPRGRGQQGRDFGCDAVLQDPPRVLDLRRRPGARFVHAAPGSCSGAPGKRLQLSGSRRHLSRRLARAPGARGARGCWPSCRARGFFSCGTLRPPRVCFRLPHFPWRATSTIRGQWQEA